MSDALYEQYREALRRGHVAALRGRLDAAIVAYTEAAAMAPDRALPHAGLGRVLLKLDRPIDAVAAFETALERAPQDEAALAGRADALAALGRRVDAAETLDALSRIQEADGRLPEACDTARRALELAESRDRRRHVGALAQRLRAVPADALAAAALDRALGMLEPMAAPPSPAGAPGTPGETAPIAMESGAAAGAPDELAAEPAPDLVEQTATGIRLTAEAADRLDAGDPAAARDALVAAATAHWQAGNVNAALDACYLALEVTPGDAELHLLLARLFVQRGWQGHANEKLRLLDRLTALSGDTATRAELHRFVAALANASDQGDDEERAGGPVGEATIAT